MVDSSSNMAVNINSTVLQYESFINDVLKEDLRKVLNRREEIYSKIAEYLQLKRTIEQIMEGKSSAKVLTDLGCNFYCQAEIADTSKVLVCVGLDTFVEFSHSEGLEFINKKVNYLTKQAETLSIQGTKIKGFVKLILSGLKDLQLLELNDNLVQRNNIF